MPDKLVSEEVLVAFDHVARITDAFNQKPDDFVAFPAPADPKGRAYMQVIAGVAIPSTATDMEAAKALAADMMQPETQVATLRATNFFQVVDVVLPDDMPASPDALPVLLPMDLGDLNGQFNQVYADTFERIILGGQGVRAVLDQQSGARSWPPDTPSEGHSPVN